VIYSIGKDIITQQINIALHVTADECHCSTVSIVMNAQWHPKSTLKFIFFVTFFLFIVGVSIRFSMNDSFCSTGLIFNACHTNSIVVFDTDTIRVAPSKYFTDSTAMSKFRLYRLSLNLWMVGTWQPFMLYITCCIAPCV